MTTHDDSYRDKLYDTNDDPPACFRYEQNATFSTDTQVAKLLFESRYGVGQV